MTMQTQSDLKKFKSQPWILYDTVASTTFLLGAATNAIGATTPAISASGEIYFFNAPGRTRGGTPWYTNLDQPGQLSYGFEVWQVYLHIMVPTMPMATSYDPDNPAMAATQPNVPPTTRLVESIINFGVLSFELGQENQMEWPCSRFNAGGGIVDSASSVSRANNGMPAGSNVLALPEPIEMPRTQNLWAKIRLAAEVQALIGTPATPGVGAPLNTQSYTVASGDTNELQLQPYAIQLGFVGRRIKDTQYGQVPTR